MTDLAVEDTLSESVLRSTLRYERDPKVSLEVSAEGAYNRLDTESLFRSDGRAIPLPAGNVVVSERRGELGTLATWKPGPTFSLTGAVKLETSSLTAGGDLDLHRRLTYLKPRIVLAWSPNDRMQLRLRGEHEVNQIRFQNFVAQYEAGLGTVRAGNPNLRPRRAWVGEAALERQFWTGASVVLTLRHFRLKDVVEQRPLAAFGNAIAIGNIGDGEMTEASTTATLPLKRLGLHGMNLKATATWRTSEVTDPTTGDPRRLSGMSSFLGEAHFSHDLPNWKITWGVDAIYLGPAAVYRPTIFERVGAQVKVSAFVEYRVREDLNLRVEGFNLNDEHTPWVIDTFSGLRGSAPLRYIEERRMGWAPRCSSGCERPSNKKSARRWRSEPLGVAELLFVDLVDLDLRGIERQHALDPLGRGVGMLVAPGDVFVEFAVDLHGVVGRVALVLAVAGGGALRQEAGLHVLAGEEEGLGPVGLLQHDRLVGVGDDMAGGLHAHPHLVARELEGVVRAGDLHGARPTELNLRA